jgi:hypothetical protein
VISRARVVDAGRIITAGGIASGMERGLHLLRRAGYAEDLIGEIASCRNGSSVFMRAPLPRAVSGHQRP